MDVTYGSSLVRRRCEEALADVGFEGVERSGGALLEDLDEVGLGDDLPPDEVPAYREEVAHLEELGRPEHLRGIGDGERVRPLRQVLDIENGRIKVINTMRIKSANPTLIAREWS